MLKNLSAWLFLPGLVLVIWGELAPKAPDVLGWDKAEHFIAYFGLAAMLSLILVRRRLAPAIVGLILFSGMLEILQGYTGRDPQWGDFLTNGLGALAGTAAGVGALRWLGPLVAADGSD